MNTYYCLKCDLETAAETCPQCKTLTFDRSRVPESIIKLNRMVTRWRRENGKLLLRRIINIRKETSGGRETRV